MSETTNTRENRPARYNAYPAERTGATVVGELSAVVARERSKRPATGANAASFELARRARLRGVQTARQTLVSKVGDIRQLRGMTADEALSELSTKSAYFRGGSSLGDVKRGTTSVRETPPSEEQRQEMLRRVRESGEKSAAISTTEARGQFGKDMLGTYGFQPPMDSADNDHIREGISFTAAHRSPGGQSPSVVIDYRFKDPFDKRKLVVTRVAVDPEVAYQVLDATTSDPTFGRQVAGAVLNGTAMSIGGEEALDSLMAGNPAGEVQVFDGITHGTLQANADKNFVGNSVRRFPPADAYLQYPVHKTPEAQAA